MLESFIQLKLIQLRHWIHLSFMIEFRIIEEIGLVSVGIHT